VSSSRYVHFVKSRNFSRCALLSNTERTVEAILLVSLFRQPSTYIVHTRALQVGTFSGRVGRKIESSRTNTCRKYMFFGGIRYLVYLFFCLHVNQCWNRVSIDWPGDPVRFQTCDPVTRKSVNMWDVTNTSLLSQKRRWNTSTVVHILFFKASQESQIRSCTSNVWPVRRARSLLVIRPAVEKCPSDS